MDKQKQVAFKKSNHGKSAWLARKSSASVAIGELEKNQDTFILTYGQFSLIDAVVAVLDKTGPAHVAISTWTAAHADLTRSAELLESAEILSLKMIVDRSFPTRQPEYFRHLKTIFGPESIRLINTHAKFVTIGNDDWKIVIRTSMNLNGNPRIENIEVSENAEFYAFFQTIVSDIFSEIPPAGMKEELALSSLSEYPPYQLLVGDKMNVNALKEASYSHAVE